MTTIYKYPLPTESGPGNYILELPLFSKPLSVGIQNGETFMWALICDPDEKMTERRDLAIAFTGNHSTPDLRDDHRFIGTLQLRGFVFHYFIGGPK